MSSLKSYLTTIADAIREKKGTTEPINASNFASEILSIQGGGSLNLAYGLTPPTDTSKIWLQCPEPQGVEVQNYLGECAVSNVANWGGIDNPVSGFSSFYSDYFITCYIGNNQIAIVGYNHIRIYDLTTKTHIADYTISVGTSSIYSNVLFKDNVLYFGYSKHLYSFELSTQTLTSLYSTSYNITYIFFSGDNTIDFLYADNSYVPHTNYHYRYNLTNNTATSVSNISSNYYGSFYYLNGVDTVRTNDYIYYFNYEDYTSSQKRRMKYNLNTNKVEEFTSWVNFLTSLGASYFSRVSAIYDGDRYIYIIGGGNSSIGYNHIIKYDTMNDTFEMLGISLLGGKANHFSLLIDNRVYIFGGNSNNGDTRPNQIDYFDLQYPLTQNNAILTINNKTYKYLPLINTEKLKINSNIASAYLGNADNLAEKVNAYYYDGSKWVGINCDDYTEE